jgi:hypothetical protein
MPFSIETARILAEPLVTAFFQETAGAWHSERRYYTLSNGKTQEVVSQIAIAFLEPGHPHLLHLTELHQLSPNAPLICGTSVSWESNYIAIAALPPASPSPPNTYFATTAPFNSKPSTTDPPLKKKSV